MLFLFSLNSIMWQLASILLIIHCAFGVPKSMEPRIDPLVETKLGLIRGLMLENEPFSQFLGIPYALVDEENPFGPSVPHPQFEETFNAFDSSVMCPQVSMQGEFRGQIQCLNLNVYVPNKASSENRLPVMVYIYGGAFIEDTGNLIGTPSYLVQKEVIVVSINYRVGIYGFMCTESSKAPGNVGLRDQLLALRWINEHIGSFGGDNNKITIFGESAGGMSVHLHFLSHHEKLFHGAIIQSGPATSPWTFVDINNSIPLKIAETLGFVTEVLDEAIDFVAKTNVELAVAVASQLTSTSQYSSQPLTKPCVEKEFEGIERFITENPNIAKSEKAKTIPVIIGFASQELIFQHEGQQEEFYNNYSFKDMLEFGFDVTDFDNMSDFIRHFYIGDEIPSKKLKNEITSFASDFVFNHPTKRAVKQLVENGAKAVYHYKFSYEGARNFFVNTTLAGASHTDEINYLFETQFVTDDITVQDQLMIDRMTTMWTNFAKYGDPIPETSDLLPVKWEPVSKETTPYLEIDSNLKLEFRPFHDRMAFWDLFYELNESKTKWYLEEV